MKSLYNPPPWLEHQIKNNSKFRNRLTNYLNVPNDFEFKFLVSGSYARIYSLPDNRVLKITYDASDADTAFRLINREVEYLVPTFDSFNIGMNDCGDELYGIVTKKLKPLPKEALNFIKSAQCISCRPKDILAKFNFHENNYYEYREWLQGFIKELKKERIRFSDFHQGNFLYDPDDSTIKLVDFGTNDGVSADYAAVPYLESLVKNNGC